MHNTVEEAPFALQSSYVGNVWDIWWQSEKWMRFKQFWKQDDHSISTHLPKKDNIEQRVDIKRIPSKLKQSKCETHLFKCKLVEITTEFTFTDTSLNILLLHATHLHAFPLHTSGFRIFLYNSHESARAHFESDTSAVNSRALHNTRALCVAPWPKWWRQCDIAMHARADQITKWLCRY